VLISCPVCGSRILKPLAAGKSAYLVEGNQALRPLGKLRAYSCGSNEHIVFIPAQGNPASQISETQTSEIHILDTNSASAALVSHAREKEQILNSWKEIAAHMGRGVRTVQRWEQELGLPVRRPRGKSRSAVIALAADLDEWLHRAPVGLDRSHTATLPILKALQRTGWNHELDREKTKGPNGVR
jgi:DNA-binding transcriptional regulator YiaG